VLESKSDAQFPTVELSVISHQLAESSQDAGREPSVDIYGPIRAPLTYSQQLPRQWFGNTECRLNRRCHHISSDEGKRVARISSEILRKRRLSKRFPTHLSDIRQKVRGNSQMRRSNLKQMPGSLTRKRSRTCIYSRCPEAFRRRLVQGSNFERD
jgi:hypothetical protein